MVPVNFIGSSVKRLNSFRGVGYEIENAQMCGLWHLHL